MTKSKAFTTWYIIIPVAVLLVLLIGISLTEAASNHKATSSYGEIIHSGSHAILSDSLQEMSISDYHQDRFITNQELQKELNPTINNKNQPDVSNVTEDAQWNYFRKKVHGGQNVVVELLDGQRIKGKLKEITPDELVLVRDKKEIRIHKQEIVKVKKQRKLVKSTLIGLAVGFGAGILWGKITASGCNNCEDADLKVLVGIEVGSIFGTAGGFITGLARGGVLYKGGVAPGH